MRRNRHLSVLILKKEKKVNSLKVIRAIVFVLLWVGQIAAEIWAGLNTQRLDMVPKRLFIYGVVVLLLLWIFEGLLFFYGNGQEKGSKKGRQINLRLPQRPKITNVLAAMPEEGSANELFGYHNRPKPPMC